MKRFHEIIFIIPTPLTQRDESRFGIERLIQRGFKVLVLDLTSLLNPGYLENYESGNASSYQGIIVVKEKKEVVDFFRAHKYRLVVDMMGGSSRNIFVYQILKKFNIPYALFCSNHIPLPPAPEKKFVHKALKAVREMRGVKISREGALRKLKFVQYYLPSWVGRIQPPKYILVGGDQYTFKMPRMDKKTEFIRAHTLDYDLFLENREVPVSSREYAVFLDEYFPYHPDFLLEVVGPLHVNADNYYKGLNQFFFEIEKKMGIHIIIAAHPSSRYDLKPECFPGFEIQKGRTLELVKGAKFVLAHSSTSVNFAVLYHKPIVFLTSDAINAIPQGRLILHFAKQFKKEPVNVDRIADIDLFSEIKIDESSYHRYYSNYIKASGSPDKPFWDIVADHLQGAVH